MCKLFSLVSDGNGKIMYFDWTLREKCLKKEFSYEPDSHTSIADYFGYKGKDEDILNKYEYNPLTKEFKVDQLNTIDDSDKVKQFCLNLDFKTIVPQLIIKPIVNPLMLPKIEKVTGNDIALLKQWDSVWASVWDSVWASVWDSVRASVGDSVWDSVWASVWDSVWASVWDSVWASVRAYISTYFDIKYNFDYSSSNKLWERGLVPSFDGKIWRLHTGKNADIVFEIEKSKLMEGK